MRTEDFESKRLTDTERAFAELHHDTVYSFMKLHHLNFEEWYTEIIEGYLKAVRDYCRKAYANEFSFTTFAYRSMNDCVLKAYRKENAKSRMADKLAISLDVLVNAESDDGNGMDMKESISDGKDFTIDLETRELATELYGAMTEFQRELARLLMNGKKASEIAREKDIPYTRISRESKLIRELIAEICR